MLKRIEIFDMDGVLACSLHRTVINEENLLDLGHWLANNVPEQVEKDGVLPTAEYYKECLQDPEVYVIICTVRELKAHDFKWIEKNLGNPDKILYPAKNVGNSGAKFKVRALNFLTSLKQFAKLPAHFHEDNMKYLAAVCDAHRFTGHYYPSEYGVAGVFNNPFED